MISLAAPCKGIQTRFRLSSNVITRLPGELHGCWCQIVRRRVHETAPMAAMISLTMFTATSGWAVGAKIVTQGVGTPYRQVAVYQNSTWTVSDEPCWSSCQVTFLSDGEGWAWGPSNDVNNTDGFWHYRNGTWTAISFPGLDPYSTVDMAFNSPIDGWAVEEVDSFSSSPMLSCRVLLPTTC